MKEPIVYFNYYFTTELLELIVDQSNLFERQCDVNYDLNLTIAELHKILSMSMFMGVFGLPFCRMHLKSASRVNVVADTMFRNRWESIKRCLHLTDNKDQSDNCNEKLYKIRPLVDALKTAFNNVSMDEKHSIESEKTKQMGGISL